MLYFAWQDVLYYNRLDLLWPKIGSCPHSVCVLYNGIVCSCVRMDGRYQRTALKCSLKC